MTNYEYYKEQIERFARMGQKVAVKKDTNEIVSCVDIVSGCCDDCLFGGYGNCAQKAIAWADAEYIEPNVNWYKMTVDTPIMVSSNNIDWYCRHFAKYENGLFYVWDDGRTSYTTNTKSMWKYAKLVNENQTR
jgi:hypothetical protein